MPQGNYVTDDTLGKVESEVWSDETVNYIAKGSGNVKAKFQGSTSKLSSTKGWPRMVATDQRVFIKIPQITGSKVEEVQYEDLSAADIGSSGLTGTQIKLRTIRGKTYTFKADEPGDAELEEMVDYIREQISNHQPAEQATSSGSANRADLHKTESCVECGEGVSEGVSRCPHCGFNPSDHKKWRWIHVALCMTVVLIPISLPKARAHAKKAKGGVTG
ncbi:PH domain-containing protein [Halovenus halobia]|uniref:PH domain-containing protein n=1 Tax=Halovenus halobia TaxID=3396622 RepID=UPI003F54A75F